MKSIADFKRACTPGAMFWFCANWFEGQRKCVKANSVGAYLTIEDRTSFIDWPKKDEVEFVLGGILLNRPDFPHVLFYRPGIPSSEEKQKIRDHVMEVYRQKNGV